MGSEEVGHGLYEEQEKVGHKQAALLHQSLEAISLPHPPLDDDAARGRPVESYNTTDPLLWKT